jgi:hypothetical protein
MFGDLDFGQWAGAVQGGVQKAADGENTTPVAFLLLLARPRPTFRRGLLVLASLNCGLTFGEQLGTSAPKPYLSCKSDVSLA